MREKKMSPEEELALRQMATSQMQQDKSMMDAVPKEVQKYTLGGMAMGKMMGSDEKTPEEESWEMYKKQKKAQEEGMGRLMRRR